MNLVRRPLARLAAAATIALIGSALLAPLTASAAPAVGTGAVAVRDSTGALLVGATIEIRQGDCSGPAVWRHTTTAAPNAYGAFAFTLATGSYCVVPLTVPTGWTALEPTTMTVQARSGNWHTVWVAAPLPAIVVGKSGATGDKVDGVAVSVRAGTCAENGVIVSSGTTRTTVVDAAGFRTVPLAQGPYCVTATSVPIGYGLPAPTDYYAAAWASPWATLWLPSAAQPL